MRRLFSSDAVPPPSATKFEWWFRGHMTKGMRQMQKVLKNVDCVVEVHDARIPFTGRNPLLRDRISAIKPLVVAFNKADLVTREDVEEIRRRLKNGGGVGVERDFGGVEVASMAHGGAVITVLDVPSPPAGRSGDGEAEYVFMGLDTADRVSNPCL
jgi:hypothetical protein